MFEVESVEFSSVRIIPKSVRAAEWLLRNYHVTWWVTFGPRRWLKVRLRLAAEGFALKEAKQHS